jgi:hypothetical protein
VVQLHREVAAFRERNAELAIIGNGRPEAAQEFIRALALTVRVFVDPRRTTYAAFEFSRGGPWGILSRGVFRNLARALRGGFRQGLVHGDAWQLGGVIVITPSGECIYRYASREVGDHPPPAEILAALDRFPSLFSPRARC